MTDPKRIIVGITGASGAIYGIRLLEALSKLPVESHLVVSKWGARTLEHETEYRLDQVHAFASVVHPPGDQGATISSGSYRTEGMVVAPCSMSTLAAIATGQGQTLVHRAADVVLKERRKLVLGVRESPLHEIHLESMLKLARMGAVILPLMPGFYNKPSSIDDLVNHVVMRMLDQFGFDSSAAPRWAGMSK